MQEAGFPGFGDRELVRPVRAGGDARAAGAAARATTLNAVLGEPDVAAKLAEMGSGDVRGTPAQFRAFIGKELPYWESLVKRSGATVD